MMGIIVFICVFVVHKATTQDYLRDADSFGGDEIFQSPGFPDQKYSSESESVTWYRARVGHRAGCIEGLFDNWDPAPGQKLEIFYGGASPDLTHDISSAGRPNFVSSSYSVIFKFTNPARESDGVKYSGWRVTLKFHLDEPGFYRELAADTDCGKLKPIGGYHHTVISNAYLNKPLDCIWVVKPFGGRKYAFLNITSLISGRSKANVIAGLQVLASIHSGGDSYNIRAMTDYTFSSSNGLYIRFEIGRHELIYDHSFEFVYMPFDYAPVLCPTDQSSYHYDFCCSGSFGKMIPWNLRCDGKKHCGRGDDENPLICGEKRTYGGTADGAYCHSSCKASKTKRWCYTTRDQTSSAPWGYCLASIADKTKLPATGMAGEKCHEYRYADKKRCPHGECVDSTHFPNFCPSMFCESGMWKCHDGYCVYRSMICDGTKNCFDGSDETEFCRSSCGTGQWKCSTMDKCIKKAWICDGSTDCDDDSDEQNCWARKITTPATTTKSHTYTSDDNFLGTLLPAVIIVPIIVIGLMTLMFWCIYRRRRSYLRNYAQRPVAVPTGSAPVTRPHVVYRPTTSTVETMPPDGDHVTEPSAPPAEDSTLMWSNQPHGDGVIPTAPQDGRDGSTAPPPSYNEVMTGGFNGKN